MVKKDNREQETSKRWKLKVIKKITAPGRGRTYDLLLRKQTLYPLSYRHFDVCS